MKKSEKLYNALMAMPYYRNYQAVSGNVHNISKHEDAVEQVLLNNGLEKKSFKALSDRLGFNNRKEFRNFLLEDYFHEKLPDNTFYSQPTGTHDSPDFIFKVNNKVFLLECKSSKDNKPMYNSGLPKKGYVYLFCSEKSNQTTMFLGEDIVNDTQRELIEEYNKAQKEIIEKFNMKLAKTDEQNRGICYFERNMWNQAGGKEKADYFTHESRAQCEQNVKSLFLR